MGGGCLQTEGSASTGVGSGEKTNESTQDGLQLLELATDLAPDFVKDATCIGSEGATKTCPAGGSPCSWIFGKGIVRCRFSCRNVRADVVRNSVATQMCEIKICFHLWMCKLQLVVLAMNSLFRAS